MLHQVVERDDSLQNAGTIDDWYASHAVAAHALHHFVEKAGARGARTNNVDCCARVCHAPSAAALGAMRHGDHLRYAKTQAPVRSRCLHPGQQQGRRWPASSSSWVLRMRRCRVTSCFASSTQQMNSLRASGVMSRHAASAAAFASNASRKSAGSLCTTPPGTRLLVTEQTTTQSSTAGQALGTARRHRSCFVGGTIASSC